jgi:hypothetical protein
MNQQAHHSNTSYQPEKEQRAAACGTKVSTQAVCKSAGQR